jgi:hypothetical protein
MLWFVSPTSAGAALDPRCAKLSLPANMLGWIGTFDVWFRP